MSFGYPFLQNKIYFAGSPKFAESFQLSMFSTSIHSRVSSKKESLILWKSLSMKFWITLYNPTFSKSQSYLHPYFHYTLRQRSQCLCLPGSSYIPVEWLELRSLERAPEVVELGLLLRTPMTLFPFTSTLLLRNSRFWTDRWSILAPIYIFFSDMKCQDCVRSVWERVCHLLQRWKSA